MDSSIHSYADWMDVFASDDQDTEKNDYNIESDHHNDERRSMKSKAIICAKPESKPEGAWK